MGELKHSFTNSSPRYWMEVSGLLRAPAVLMSGKQPQYPLIRRLGAPQRRLEICEERNLLVMQGIEPRFIYPLARSLVALPTELP
jgi:hypothetical protein